MSAVIIEAEFDRTKPDVEREVDVFWEKVDALKKQHGFTHYLKVAEDDGPRVRVKIIPCVVAPQRSLEAMTPTRQTLGLLGKAEPIAMPEAKKAPCPHAALRVSRMMEPPRHLKRAAPRKQQR